VEHAVWRWAEAVAHERPDVVRIGVFGSFARGDWGMGSDLDLLVLVADSDKPFPARASDFDTTSLPVPADLLVYTEAEWDALRSERRRLARTAEREARWLYTRPR